MPNFHHWIEHAGIEYHGCHELTQINQERIGIYSRNNFIGLFIFLSSAYGDKQGCPYQPMFSPSSSVSGIFLPWVSGSLTAIIPATMASEPKMTRGRGIQYLSSNRINGQRMLARKEHMRQIPNTELLKTKQNKTEKKKIKLNKTKQNKTSISTIQGGPSVTDTALLPAKGSKWYTIQIWVSVDVFVSSPEKNDALLPGQILCISGSHPARARYVSQCQVTSWSLLR